MDPAKSLSQSSRAWDWSPFAGNASQLVVNNPSTTHTQPWYKYSKWDDIQARNNRFILVLSFLLRHSSIVPWRRRGSLKYVELMSQINSKAAASGISVSIVGVSPKMSQAMWDSQAESKMAHQQLSRQPFLKDAPQALFLWMKGLGGNSLG